MKFASFLIYSNIAAICITSCSFPQIREPMKVGKSWLTELSADIKEKFQNKAENSDFNAPDASLFPEGSLTYFPPTAQKLKTQSISSKYDVRNPTFVTSAQLNKVLVGKLKGKGSSIIKIAKQYGICPLFLAALCCHESAAGTSKYAQDYNNVSGQLKYNKSTGKWSPIYFENVDSCITRTAKNLKENYINSGRISIGKIQQKFCPIITNRKSKDFNDPSGKNIYWTAGVLKWMNRIV